MENFEFRVLLKRCSLMGKIQSNRLISVIRSLLRPKQRLRRAMLTLNIVVLTQMMLNAVLADCKLKLREIAEKLKISERSVFTILHEHLLMRKLCSKWMLRLLTVDQKRQHVDDSERCLQLLQHNKKEFLRK